MLVSSMQGNINLSHPSKPATACTIWFSFQGLKYCLSIDNRDNKLARFLLFLGSGQVESSQQGFQLSLTVVEITEGNLKVVLKASLEGLRLWWEKISHMQRKCGSRRSPHMLWRYYHFKRWQLIFSGKRKYGHFRHWKSAQEVTFEMEDEC